MPTPLKNKKKEKKWDSLKPPTAEPLPAKKVKNKTGKNVKQYPPRSSGITVLTKQPGRNS